MAGVLAKLDFVHGNLGATLSALFANIDGVFVRDVHLAAISLRPVQAGANCGL
jgi:hypothetical protein